MRGDDEGRPFSSRFCLHENELRLTAAHQMHSAIRLGGGGRYSHWQDEVFFSTSDGSDPNTNGRIYSFDFSLDLAAWEEDRAKRSAQRWFLHPTGADFIARGGDRIPPPLTANLCLTNKCNLRCEICGSQKHLDIVGTRRRHMDFGAFEAVAETLFPVLSEVELNSQGDPLLHPRIVDILSTIEHHRCEIKVQHNGTLLRDSVIDHLFTLHGTVMLSLDAVGAKFDEVRQGGNWNKAEPGLRRFLCQRDRSRLSVGVYPTWTQRTIGEAINIAEWCVENHVDLIAFHRYVPVQGSWEQAPTAADYSKACDELRKWCIRNKDPLRVSFEGEGLNSKVPPDRREDYASLEKTLARLDADHVIFPTKRNRPGSDAFAICAAPNEYLEIGLDGQVSVCCRSQDITLGYATSVGQFSDVWFGSNYAKIRQSLRRDERGAFPLPNCSSCIEFYAPGESGGRKAVDYTNPEADQSSKLTRDQLDVLAIDAIQKENGFCHIAVFPLGIDTRSFELWEDDQRLGPRESLHDDIRSQGAGRYHIGVNSVYFSASDCTDARRNGRTYSLRRIASAKH
jgi:MoaA/NifB/PqqE/SkfB family radical SAM enzyme